MEGRRIEMNGSKPIKAQIQENPVVSVMMGIILLASVTTGTLTAFGTFNSLVMTHAEHAADIEPLKLEVVAVDLWNKCERLERRIVELEDRKWKRAQAGAGADAIRDIERDITNERRKYNALGCASILN